MSDETLSIPDRFRRMAADIERNPEAFGGAYVIIPPLGLAPIDVLILDRQENPAQFYMLLSAKIQQALKDVEDMERRGMTFGR